MKHGKLFYKRICPSIVISLILAVSGAEAWNSDVVKKQKGAVVTVHVNGKNGKHILSESGFVVDREGIIAVSCNVIPKWLEEIENTIVAETEGGDSLSMSYVISDNCRDNFVLIKVQAEELPVVILSSGHKPSQGEGIVVMSRSPGSEITLLNGRISSVRKKGEYFQVTVPITQERDGSPVFNLKGEVIGISTLLSGKRQRQHIVIPVKYILKEISRYPATVKETTTAPARIIPPSTASVPNALEKPHSGKNRDNAEQAFLRGLAYEKSNMYREAVEAYNEALGIKPDFIDAYINLGLLNYKIGRYPEAVDAYKHAVKINPDNLSAYNKLGAVYIILGEYSMAIDAFRQSIRISPNNAETHFNLGLMFVISGDKDGAIGEYVTLKKLDRELADKLLDLIY